MNTLCIEELVTHKALIAGEVPNHYFFFLERVLGIIQQDKIFFPCVHTSSILEDETHT